MKIYHRISRLMPESKIKNKFRNIFYSYIYPITFGHVTIKLSDKNNITGKFSKQLFVKHKFENILPELIGYQQHYIPKNGDFIIDAGTYIGEFAIYASKLVGKKGKVICFEPDKGNLRLLKKNIKLNKLNNVIVIEKGLWNKDTVLKFKTHGLGSVLEKFENSKHLFKKVGVTNLDIISKKLKLPKINMVKMDIEGAEIEALEGCKEVMKKNNINFAIASYHKVNGEATSKKLMDIFKKRGYSSITEYPIHPTTYAKKMKKDKK